jgi:hypothetical protein
MALERKPILLKASPEGQGEPGVIAALALQILVSHRIELSRAHVSGIADAATARRNTVHQMFESLAHRSSYDNAPGGTVALDVRMLRAILQLGTRYTFSISEVAGGSHSAGSSHYRGTAFDVNVIDKVRVTGKHPTYRSFMEDCRQLGAAQVLGPPAHGHETHVHAAWPK